jgi:hypothetical protein
MASEIDNEYFQDPIYGDTYPMSECTIVDGKFKFYFKSLWDWFNDIKKFTNPITNMDFNNENIIAFVLKAKDMDLEKTKLSDSLMETFLMKPSDYFNICSNQQQYLLKLIKQNSNSPTYTSSLKSELYSQLIITDEKKKELKKDYDKFKSRYMELKLKEQLGLILTKEVYEMNFILSKVNYNSYFQKLGLKL